MKFKKMLEEELRSSVQPQYKDKIGETSQEDLTRDLYRVLVGNGGFQMGIMYKVAFTNVMLDKLVDKLNMMSDKLDTQVERCDAVQAAKKHQADLDKAAKDAADAATKELLSKTGPIPRIDDDGKPSPDTELANEVKEALTIVKFLSKHKKVIGYYVGVFSTGALGWFGGSKLTTTTPAPTKEEIRQEISHSVAVQMREILKEIKEDAASNNTGAAPRK
jgi:hypothetical protein